MSFKHRNHKHDTVAQARKCEDALKGLTTKPSTSPVRTRLLPEHQECRGGKCGPFDMLCSFHSQAYQQRYGRAANE